MKRKTCITFLTVIFTLLQISCGSDSKSSDKTSDVDFIPDSDAVEVSDSTEENDSDTPSTDIDTEKESELDESFIAESRGLTVLAKGKIIPSPGNNPVDPIDQLEKLVARLNLGDGESVSFDKLEGSSISEGGYGDIEISLSSQFKDMTYYTLMASINKSKMGQMKENGENISDDSMINNIAVQKIDYPDGGRRVTACPVAMLEKSDENKLYFTTDDTEWKTGDPVGLMMNLSVVTGEKNIEELAGKKLHELCSCFKYENNQYVYKKCEIKDFHPAPSAPEPVSPENRSLSKTGDIELSFKPSVDPDGYAVKYDVYFGENPLTLEKVAENIETTSHSVSAVADKNYFWKVVANSETGHVVESVLYGFSTKEASPFTDVLIVINKNIEEGTKDSIATYRKDLETKNLNSEILIFPTDGSVDDLKTELKKRYENNFIQGAFLLGDIPSAWFELDNKIPNPDGSTIVLKEQFPTDFYVMDFEANWEDLIDNGTEEDKTVKNEPNGIYDKHTPLNLRIFTARLLGSADNVNNYIEKLHRYKTEGSFLKNSMFLYLDDDWADEASAASDWFLGSFYDIDSIWGKDDTTITRYKDEIKEGHEFVYQWIHSDPHNLYFNQNFGDDIIPIDQLETMGVKGSFYNLFDCSASRFNDPDFERDGKPVSLADMYVKTEFGIATIGSSKVGGMYNPEHFHGNLAKGKSWGESYRIWFNNSGKADDTWWLGMTILGDPTVTLNKQTRRSIRSHRDFFFTPDQVTEMKRKMIVRQKAFRNR